MLVTKLRLPNFSDRGIGMINFGQLFLKKVREKSRECHNHKPQPFPDPKRKRKPTNLNKHKPNKRTKCTKISSLFPKRGNRNTKRNEKNKMTHGKTYNKSPLRINHKATRNKTNTGTTPKFYRRHYGFVSKYDTGIKSLLLQGLLEPWPSCSKLRMSLVNVSLKFLSLNMQNTLIYLLKKMWVAFACHIIFADKMWSYSPAKTTCE